MLVERVAAELDNLHTGAAQGMWLLYNGLPIHSLGRSKLPRAVCSHLARLCIAAAPTLLARLVEAAGVDEIALRSTLALAQRLDCLVVAVQDEVAASRGYWEEL